MFHLAANSLTNLVLAKQAAQSLKGTMSGLFKSTKNFFANSATKRRLLIIDFAKPTDTPIS